MPADRLHRKRWLLGIIGLAMALVAVGVWLVVGRGSAEPAWPTAVSGKLGPFKRHTFAGGAASQITSPGRFTVLLPADWSGMAGTPIQSEWYWEKPTRGTMVPSGPTAFDVWHRATVGWSVSTELAAKGTTLAEIRSRYSFRGSRQTWGPGTPVTRQLDETYLTLPMGKVWRQSLRVDPQGKPSSWLGAGGSMRPTYIRLYWLDRGVVREASTGAKRQLFSTFTVECGTEALCRAHTGQLDAIMRSIRFA